MHTPTTNDNYAGQETHGTNEESCPFVGQTVEVAVQNVNAVLASLGYSSVAELIADANLE